MKLLKYAMVTLCVLSITACHAQIKNQTTETVKIYGNCGMCKSTIEKAGYVKKESSIDWNKETKIATLSFDSLQTSKAEILKRIALAGYDNESFLAPDDTYSNLPNCCQYKRVKDESATMEMAPNIHSAHFDKMTELQNKNPLSKVYDNYFVVKDALVKTDGAIASTSAKNLLTAINDVKMDKLPMDVHIKWMDVLENIKEDSEYIANTTAVSQQRDHFMSLSKNFYEVMQLDKKEGTTYYQFCPMANDGKGANWLSKDETIKNPYYGSQMLSCGKTIETLNQ